MVIPDEFIYVLEMVSYVLLILYGLYKQREANYYREKYRVANELYYEYYGLWYDLKHKEEDE